MKKFTPPPVSSSSSEGESEEESEEVSEASVVLDDIVRSSDKTEDEYLKMASKGKLSTVMQNQVFFKVKWDHYSPLD